MTLSLSLSRYHSRIRREKLFCLSVETICEALRDHIEFKEPVMPWWLADQRRAA